MKPSDLLFGLGTPSKKIWHMLHLGGAGPAGQNVTFTKVSAHDAIMIP